MGKNDKFDLNATNLLAYIMRRLKVLLAISFAAAVITAILSLFIPNKFKSSVVLFPTAQVSVSRTLADINYGKGKGELLSVGEQEELDQLQQMLNSSDMMFHIIQRFNLMEHYKINPGSKGAKRKVLAKLNSNIKINRTEYGSVIVNVWDEDAEFAAKMANYIPDYLDTLYFNMEKDRANKAYQLIKNEYDSITFNIQLLKDSLQKINRLGVVHILSQSQELTKAYYKALLRGRNDIAEKARKSLNLIEENGSQLIVLHNKLEYIIEEQSRLAAKMTVAKVEMKDNLSRKFIVNKAHTSDYKDSPKRSIIVIVAAIAAFFTALLAFIVAENIKRLRE